MSARRPIDLAARAALALDDADDAGPADAGHDLVAAERLELVGDDRRRCGARRTGVRGAAWRSRRQAAISSAKSATRLMTGMGQASLRGAGRSGPYALARRGWNRRAALHPGARSSRRAGLDRGPRPCLTCAPRGSERQEFRSPEIDPARERSRRRGGTTAHVHPQDPARGRRRDASRRAGLGRDLPLRLPGRSQRARSLHAQRNLHARRSRQRLWRG